MPRATGNDLCEVFGFSPDDITDAARKQWKSQRCPFVGGGCIKHSHPQEGRAFIVYGTCSVTNKTRGGVEEVIICPQRLYAGDYSVLRRCVDDATNKKLKIFTADEYSSMKKRGDLPAEYVVLFGHNSGGEIALSNPGVISLSLDWVAAHMVGGQLASIIPCEVQSIDITGNYRSAWMAYSAELASIPDSKHGMNWANVWKRMIPQLILKGAVASTSQMCKYGLYFIVPDRVYVQFEKIVGGVSTAASASDGVLNVMTYRLGDKVGSGKTRSLQHVRTIRMFSTEFAKSFASGTQLPLGTQLDQKVLSLLMTL